MPARPKKPASAVSVRNVDKEVTGGGAKPPIEKSNRRGVPRSKRGPRGAQPTGHLAVGQRKPRAPGAKRENPRKTGAKLEVAAKRKKAAWAAIELKSQGYSLEKIAEHLGYANKSSVSRLIEQEMAATPVEKIDSLRQTEGRSLGWIQRKLIRIAKDEDESTHDRVDALKALTSLSARRAKLFGLDAPQVTELTGKGGGPVAFEDISSAQDDIDKRLDQLSEELFGGKRPGATGGERKPAGDAGPREPVEGSGRGEPPAGEARSDSEAAGADPDPSEDPSV